MSRYISHASKKLVGAVAQCAPVSFVFKTLNFTGYTQIRRVPYLMERRVLTVFTSGKSSFTVFVCF